MWHQFFLCFCFVLSPAGGADPAAAVEVAAELREVNRGRPGRRAVQAEVSGRRRLPGLLHARERGEDLLLGSGRERRGGRRGRHVRSGRGGDGGERGSGRGGGFVEGGGRGRRERGEAVG